VREQERAKKEHQSMAEQLIPQIHSLLSLKRVKKKERRPCLTNGASHEIRATLDGKQTSTSEGRCEEQKM